MLLHKLTETEVEQLSEFRFATTKTKFDQSILVKELLDETTLLRYFDKLSKHVKSPSIKVTASLFIKRYSFLVVNSLYAMTALNKKLNVSIDNLSLETDSSQTLWLPAFYFYDTSVEQFDSGNRDEWRRNCIRDLFAQNVYPVLEKVSRVSKVSKLILWENIALYIFWLYESILQGDKDVNRARLAKEDFSYIIKQAEGSLFGKYNENPLKKFYNEKVYMEEHDEFVRPRITCCFSYFIDEKMRCKTCPQTCPKGV